MTKPRPEIDFIDPRSTPPAPIRYRGELPHLYKENGSYFVTFRLWDAITPLEQRREWQRLQRIASQHSPRHQDVATAKPYPNHFHDLTFIRQLAEATEPPLQLGSCILRDPRAARIVQDALLHFHGERYQLAAWCVMPNHVHVAYTTLGIHAPDDIHHSWKSYASHEINKCFARKGTLWERESFDHLIRTIDDYAAFIEYIENNPVAANLCESPSNWEFSSAAYFS